MRILMLIGVLACAGVVRAQEEHRDVLVELSPEGDRFTTGAYDFNSGMLDHDVRVFSRDFGEQSQPYYTNDPGFEAFDGSLPNNLLFGFEIVDALRLWDPVAGNFDTIPAETMTVSRFSSTATTPANAGEVVGGFFWGATGTTGGFHVHLNYFINSPQSAGVYLLTLRLTSDASSIEDPAPIYIVFNNHDPDGEAQTALAVAYVEGLINPPPACAGDIDGDGDTDVFDFGIFASHFGLGVDPGTSGDLGGDGVVDVFDFGIFASDFGCVP